MVSNVRKEIEDLITKLKIFFPDGIQCFDCRGWMPDVLVTIYEQDGITVDYCHYWRYIEIFGISKDEFKYIEKTIYIDTDANPLK